jgi:ABC-type cobalamin/Fe3+-siderophores transport system ATPase subunit
MSGSPTTDSVILRAEHLGRTIQEKILIQDATFELKKAEVLAIAGPSGSGKTSLLRLLNRLDEPTSALDDVAKLEVESSIQNVVSNHGLTCVVVTHDLAQASRLAGRALLLKSGRIVGNGPVGEVLHA